MKLSVKARYEREQLTKEKERYRVLCSKYCKRCSRDDDVITSMEMEIESLWKRLSESADMPANTFYCWKGEN